MAKAVSTRRVIRSRGNSQEGRETKNGPVPTSLQSTDYGRIAVEHFGTSASADDLESLANILSRMRRGESLGGKGSEAIRTLGSAGVAAEAAAERLRDVDLLRLIETMQSPRSAKGKAAQKPPIDAPHRMALVERIESTMMVLDHLAEGLQEAAQRQPRLKRGRPRTSRVLHFALEALDLLWRHHRGEAPTASAQKGGFALLVQDLLTSAPCDFPRGTVAKATTSYLRTGRRRDSGMLPASPPPSRAEGTSDACGWPTSVLVVGAHDPTARALAESYAEAGAAVTVTLPPGRAVPTWARSRRICVVPLDLTKPPGRRDITALGDGAIDLLVIAGVLNADGDTARPGGDVFQSIDLDHWSMRMLPLPAVLHGLMQACAPRLTQRPGAKVVVLTAQEGSFTLGDTAGYAAATTLAAVNRLVPLWARDLGAHDVTVTAVYPTWGRRADGTPNRHTVPADTARSLAGTVARLDARHHGRLTDLHGSLAPW